MTLLLEAQRRPSSGRSLALLQGTDVDALCQFVRESFVADGAGDQFAQDGLPITVEDQIDVSSAAWGQLVLAGAVERIRSQCGITPLGDVQVFCNPDKLPPADARALLTFVHLSSETQSDQLYTYGLYVRYDATTPGSAVPEGFPLYIGNAAHLQYLSPLNSAGTGYDPPVFTDYRSNSGAMSDHIQIHGPDWFAFITFDDAQFVRPYVCQLAGERAVCDVPFVPLSPEDLENLEFYVQVPPAQ